MSERSGLTVAAGLWGIAFVALGMAALTAKADAHGVVGLTCVGHALTVLALVLDLFEPGPSRTLVGRSTTILYFSAFLAIELVGILLMLALGERNLSLWFALGASFAILGIAVTWVRVPGDSLLACQLFFHSANVAPLIAALPVFLIELGQNEGLRDVLLGIRTMNLALSVGCVVAIPLLIVALATALAYNLSKPKQDQDLPWAVLTAHQLMFAVLVFRWAGDGF